MKQKALGRCTQCGTNNKVIKKNLCLICYNKRQEINKKYMDKYRKTKKWKTYYKEWREKRNKNDILCRCGHFYKDHDMDGKCFKCDCRCFAHNPQDK